MNKKMDQEKRSYSKDQLTGIQLYFSAQKIKGIYALYIWGAGGGGTRHPRGNCLSLSMQPMIFYHVREKIRCIHFLSFQLNVFDLTIRFELPPNLTLEKELSQVVRACVINKEKEKAVIKMSAGIGLAVMIFPFLWGFRLKGLKCIYEVCQKKRTKQMATRGQEIRKRYCGKPSKASWASSLVHWDY